MPQVARRTVVPFLLAVSAVLAGCLSPAASGDPSSPAPGAASGASDTAGASLSPSGGEGSAGSASTEVWLPEWADGNVPDAVANRRPLPFCGVERPPAPQPMEFVDRIVRLCFWEAAQGSEEAEWVSIQGTMEGGTIATIHRLARDGTVETLTDFTQDPFGGGGWVRTVCERVVEAEGDALVGVDGCGEGSPLR